MRIATRFLGLLLAVCLLLSVLPANAFAVSDGVTEEMTDTEEPQERYEAVTVATGTTWKTVADALKNASAGDVIRVETDAVLQENATVPAGVTLLIPCMDNDPGYILRGKYLMNPNGTDTSGKTGVGPNAALYRSLNIAEDATLTVSGSVLVNAVTGRTGAGHFDQDVTGGYAKIDLAGRIVVQDGGVLDAFGYVRGSGSVTVQNGGTAGDLYIVRNWRGGTQALKMYECNVYPMNEYDCHNIETPLCIEYGGVLEGLVKMYAGGGYNYTRFPQVSNDNGLIRLTDGGSYLVRTYEEGRECFSISGGADFADSTLVIVGLPLSTGDFIYPIDGDISFVLRGGEYRFLNDYKMLPGVRMTLEKDAELTVMPDTTVVFYKEFNDVPNNDSTQYPSDRDAAVLSVSTGACFTNEGTFAGPIYTESADILIGEAPCWQVVTYEANGYVSGLPKEEQTVAIEHVLSIERPGHVWEFGEDLSILWDAGILPGDYSAVEAALALVPEDLSVFTDESVQVLTDAIAAVVYDLNSDCQAQIDGWAEAIRAAVLGLTQKDVENKADYSAVNEALALVPTDLTAYTDESAAALQAAIDAVQYGLPADQQAQVDAMAEAILKALEGLTEKPCDGGDTCPSKHFTDVPDPSDWAHEGIDYCVEAGLFNGTSETTFEPETAMTRAMLVTVLWRYDGAEETGENIFTDVADDAWYAPAVSWAAANNIVNGIGNDRFDPDSPVTREQVAVIFCRYADFVGADITGRAALDAFADQAQVSDWAADAVSWAVANSIIGGSSEPDGVYLLPQEDATRAQIATILMRFIENYLK